MMIEASLKKQQNTSKEHYDFLVVWYKMKNAGTVFNNVQE